MTGEQCAGRPPAKRYLQGLLALCGVVLSGCGGGGASSADLNPSMAPSSLSFGGQGDVTICGKQLFSGMPAPTVLTVSATPIPTQTDTTVGGLILIQIVSDCSRLRRPSNESGSCERRIRRWRRHPAAPRRPFSRHRQGCRTVRPACRVGSDTPADVALGLDDSDNGVACPCPRRRMPGAGADVSQAGSALPKRRRPRRA
jgi:predicted small secreted protein